MEKEVHAHDVMDLMVSSGLQFTRSSAIAFIEAEFGPDTRYHTCSMSDLSAADLVNFLAARGMFLGTESGFTVNPNRVCRH